MFFVYTKYHAVLICPVSIKLKFHKKSLSPTCDEVIKKIIDGALEASFSNYNIERENKIFHLSKCENEVKNELV